MKNDKIYYVERVLNNNSLLAHDEQNKEVILLGKGIGFHKSKGDHLTDQEAVEKVFVLSTEKNKTQMVQVFSEAEEDVIYVVNEYIEYLETTLDRTLPQEFLLTLMDHVSFAIKRLRQGIHIHNPFLHEVRILYPYEYKLSEEGVRMLREGLHMSIPDDEIGFIALHLHSARTNQELGKTTRFSSLIVRLMDFIESELKITIDKNSIDYVRLLTHLRFAIERAENGVHIGENDQITELLRNEYPVYYNLSWKLVKIMQNNLQLAFSESEATYLTLHIQRIVNHMESSDHTA